MSGTTSPVKSPGWFPLKDLDDHISPAYKHVVKDFKAEALDKSISHAKQHLPSLRPLLAERVIGPKTFMVALGKMSKDYSDKNQCQQSAAWTNTTATDVVLYLVEEVLYVVEEYGSLVPDSREDVYLEIQSHGKEGRANKDAAKFHGTWNRVLVPDQANHQAFRQRWCVLPGSTIRVGLANQSTTGTLFTLTTLDLDSKGWQDNDRFIRNLPNRQERNSAEKMIRVNMLVNGDNGDRNVLKQRFSVGPPYGSEIESSKEYRFKATVTSVNNLINNGKSNVLVNHAKHKMLLICGGGKNKRGSDASGSTIVATVSLDRMFGGLESFPFSRDDPRRQLLPGDAAQFTLNPGISSAWFFALYVEEVKELSKFEENKIEADERAKWKKLEDFLQLEAKEDFPISRSLIESTFKLHQLSTEEQKGVRFRRLGGNQDWITKIAPTVDTENIYCIHASEFDENGNKRSMANCSAAAMRYYPEYAIKIPIPMIQSRVMCPSSEVLSCMSLANIDVQSCVFMSVPIFKNNGQIAMVNQSLSGLSVNVASVNPASRKERTCDGCGIVSRKSLARCVRCGVAKYCSRACQKAHWRQSHKQECVEKKS